MQDLKRWQDLLGAIISDPKERQRIAEELNVNPITLTRWASGKSIPKREYILLLVRVIPPEFRSSFAMSLIENKMLSMIELNIFLNFPDMLEEERMSASLIGEVIDKAFREEEENTEKASINTYAIFTSLSKDYDYEHSPPPHDISFRNYLMGADYRSLNQQKKAKIFSFRIAQEPLTVQNLTSILSSLSELATKYWLISEGRFADLIEYTQTHNPRFEEEANIEITKITYNSPMNMDWKFDVSATNVAEALITTVDGITQVGKRLRKAELEVQEKEQALKETKQRADQAEKKSELEREKQQLEIEKQRLELQKQTLEIQVQQLEFQKKSFDYAIEMATKAIDTLRPGLDPDTRAMSVQAVLPNWIQLQNAIGLELVLPTLPTPATKPEEEKK